MRDHGQGAETDLAGFENDIAGLLKPSTHSKSLTD
jgi:hypothetical protein